MGSTTFTPLRRVARSVAVWGYGKRHDRLTCAVLCGLLRPLLLPIQLPDLHSLDMCLNTFLSFFQADNAAAC
jgi:hypothetical protein